jgi:hypothetical protein
MDRVISGSAPDPCAIELKLQEMDDRITVLDGEVARLSKLLEDRYAEKK